MESIIPINGRVAIVDDKIEQALPLMRVFAKNNIPYVFYEGNNYNYFPETPENDIRILFLDLNLLGDRNLQPKDIRSTLYSTLSHIISPKNYPYVLILWSLQENEYKAVLDELFEGDLKNCAPITIQDWIKSEFFPDFADTEENEDQESKLIKGLQDIIAGLPAYSYLMQWENCIHKSADDTIQGIFHDFNSQGDWENNANCILSMFAQSYLEKHYDKASDEDKTRTSLLFLNDVYYDTLESGVLASTFPNAKEMLYEKTDDDKKDIAAKINGHLLISSQIAIGQPGCVMPVKNIPKKKNLFHELFYCCFNKRELSSKEASNLKKEIYTTLQPCEVLVTPACDYAQKKVKYDRILQGVMIDAKYKDYTNSQSVACYVSPIFEYEHQKRIMVLNFRYLITKDNNEENIKPLFRLRNSILAEIQSKLARHINRQGFINL